MIRKFLLKLAQLFVRFSLHFRYRIKVVGSEILKDPRFKKHGTLILSNHVSELDPFILF